MVVGRMEDEVFEGEVLGWGGEEVGALGEEGMVHFGLVVYSSCLILGNVIEWRWSVIK